MLNAEVSESHTDRGLQPMRNRDSRLRPLSLFLLLNLAALVVACQTIEPVPLYVPPKDILFSPGLSAAAFSPSGHLAAVANFNTIWIFETASKELRKSYTGHERFGTNNTLVFLGENKIASTGSSNIPGTESSFAAIKIWDLTNPYQVPIVIQVQELERYAIALAYSRTTGALAVGGENGAVVLLESDASDSYTKMSLPGLSGPVLSLAFNQEGSLLAAGGVNPAVRIWDLQSSLEVGSLPAEDTVYDLDLVPGRRALLVTSADLKLWEFFADDEPERIKNPSLAGDTIVLGTMRATYILLAAATAAMGGYAPVMDWSYGNPSEPDYGFCKREADVSPDGRFMVDVHPGKLKEKIRIIDLSTNEVVKRLNPRGGTTCGVAFSPDGRKLLIANNRVARLYDTRTWNFDDLILD